MLVYTARRLLAVIPTILGVMFLSFIIIHAVPGNPGQVALGLTAPPKAVRAFDRQLGLDRPLFEQFLIYIKHLATLQFGDSISLQTPVKSAIASHAGETIGLVLYVLVIAVSVAIPMSIYVATHRDGIVDHCVRVLGVLTFAMPAFWLGLLLVLTFALKIRWFPVSGYGQGFEEQVRSLTLPAVTLAIGLAPLYIRTLRSSLISNLDASYIEAARSRGFSERRVLYRHVLRPSLTSLITLVGLTTGLLISSAVIVEVVFALNGLGTILVSGVGARDFPLVQGLVFIIGTAVVLINFLTDLAYAVVDPRVRLRARQ